MEKTLILYRSKGGSTARYAQALARMIGGRALPASQADDGLLARADGIVFASWMRAGSLVGSGFLRRHAKALRGKRLALMVVGLAPRLDPDSWEAFSRRALPDFLRSDARVFYLRGAYAPARQGALTRRFLTSMGRALTRKPDASADELALAHDLLQGADHVREDALSAIALYLAG